MDWVWEKLDVLIAAIFVAVAAIAASQSYVFMTQYQERLAGDLEQARARVTDVKTGLRYKLMSDVVRQELEATAQTRFDALNTAHSSIAGAGVVTKPFALMRYQDPALVADIEKGFVPRIPRTLGSILYAVIGAVIGFALYEVAKLPLLLLAEPRRRKFRRRP